MSYAQSLWQEISNEGTDLKVTNNGLVEAAYTVISMYIHNFVFSNAFQNYITN